MTLRGSASTCWIDWLGGTQGIILRLALVGLALVAASQHVMRQSSLVALLGFLLAGLILAAPLARYAAAWLVFSLARGLADDVGFPDQGGFFAEVDRWIGLGVTPTERLQDLFYTPGQLGIIDHITIWTHASYYVVPHFIAVGIWWACRRSGSRLFDKYLQAMIAVMSVGLLMYILLPTSPPWLETHGHETLDVARIVHVANADSTIEQEQIYTVFTDPNPTAAMPSLHTAITLLAALTLWALDRRPGILGLIYIVLMAFALVYLGEHYLIDVVAGVVVVVGVLVVMRALTGSPLSRARERGRG